MSPSSSASVVLLLSGSLRAGSSNEAVLRAAQEGARTVRYAGLGELPHFNPDDDDPDSTGKLPCSVVELSAAIAGAEALLICTPEYAGTLPGSFKNLLD
ncbi:NADPH-dependent FMN reductase [Streptomyces sp. NPDC051658]|uniref:NADPH-dependent FMN reductase n=1 Tax=Streptomyces sp. NPDC051658 TaxID=3365667 RepID=UPI00379C0FD6